MIAARDNADADRRDLAPVIHQELERLPEKYRAPLVLCYLQGKSSEEAARLLDWPVGTVKGRMSRARALLRGRLQRRGVALASVGTLLALPGSVPAALVQGAIETALRVAAAQGLAAAAVSAPVASLMRGELQAMFLSRCKLPVAGTLVLLFAAAAWFLVSSPASGNEERVAAHAGNAPAQAQADPKQEAAARQQSQKNLRDIAIAMHNYHDAFGSFPPAPVVDKNNKALLSWRVLLLPFLGERDLFKQFKLDEPWDGPNNKKLLAKMPKIYAPVLDKGAEANTTYYQVFVGEGAAFEGDRGLRITDFVDGTSNTALIIEGGEAVPWTKPADLPHDSKKALPKLGGLFKDRIHCALADGSVVTLKRDFVERAMRTLIVRNDGMVIQFADLVLDK